MKTEKRCRVASDGDKGGGCHVAIATAARLNTNMDHLPAVACMEAPLSCSGGHPS